MAIKAVSSKKTKSPPILSHEFVIQNHADIVSCIAMVFVAGIMFQLTQPLANIFVTLSHNATAMDVMYNKPPEPVLYTNGLKDLCVIFFYSLICIIIHAVIQEYIIDKITKKLHLSKTKHCRFNESSQLLAFTILITGWGIDIILKKNIVPDISLLWVGYPKVHAEMNFQMKAFFIVQIAYWLHTYPELYFLKVKKEDMWNKVVDPTIYLIFTSAAYIMNFTHVAMVLLVLRFLDDAVLHICSLLNFAEKTKVAEIGFRVWNLLFVVCRLISFIVTILTFHYGLATLEQQEFNLQEGNFNTQFLRLNSLAAVCLLQGWMMWNFIHFHLKRTREQQATAPTAPPAQQTRSKTKKYAKGKRNMDDDVSMLPEADQNTRRRYK